VILADTHVVAWLAFDPQRISRRARAAIDNARQNAEGLAISDITLLELATLVSKGRIHLAISLESFRGKSSLASSFSQSVAEPVPAPWDSRHPIRRISRIA
jgi:PIN domain nuclease of toxin-antitoxin system